MSRLTRKASPRTTEQERSAFAQRLQSALVAADVPVSATVVQRAFNAGSGQSPITVHAARKWLVGESMPTQERLRVLAAWLGVSAAWLRLGDATQPEPAKLSAQEQLLLRNYRKLGAQERQHVLALIATMAGKRDK